MNLDEIKQKTQIKSQGKFQSSDITCSYTPIYLSYNDEERSYIENEWNEEIKIKPYLFDGKLIHVKKQSLHNSRIMFSMCNSSFKEFIGTYSYEYKKLFNKNKIIRPISVGTMIITSDDKWIIGRRSKTHDYEGYYTLVAGYMDPDKDLVNSRPDPFLAAKRELIEETGVQDDDITSIICLGLSGETQPYLAFLTSVTISLDQFNRRIPEDNEFVKLESYDLTRESIESFLMSNYKKISPHTLANIFMYCSLELSV
jgi:8-oxo-dGTP pyrophosphatase MutT (NUDIX family)